jgi:hypothetical protein
MMRVAIEEVKTDLILYVEHDTPLIPNKVINWDECVDKIESGDAYTVRFHFRDVIPEEHNSLIIGKQGNFVRTYQWSQRPHLTTKLYYQQVLDSFEPDGKHFIEDQWHAIVMNDFNQNGMYGWFKHRLWIYHPKGGIQRSYNLNGRGDESKYKQSFER